MRRRPDSHVYMTSFTRSHALPSGVARCAVTVYPPKGYEHYPKIEWTDIRREDGTWIRPREFVSQDEPLLAYWEALLQHYDERLPQAEQWADALLGDVAMCCWCPHDRAAQRQLEEHQSFVCHTGPLGWWIETRLGLRVWYDEERRNMKALYLR